MLCHAMECWSLCASEHMTVWNGCKENKKEVQEEEYLVHVMLQSLPKLLEQQSHFFIYFPLTEDIWVSDQKMNMNKSIGT